MRFGANGHGELVLSGPNLIYDPNAGGDVEANLNFEAEGLTVFGPTGRRLHHWPYREIVHAFPKAERMDAVLAHPSRPELRLRLSNEAIYDQIQQRAPQLRRRGFEWKWILRVLEAMPHDAQIGIYLFAGIAIFAVYSFVAGWFE